MQTSSKGVSKGQALDLGLEFEEGLRPQFDGRDRIVLFRLHVEINTLLNVAEDAFSLKLEGKEKLENLARFNRLLTQFLSSGIPLAGLLEKPEENSFRSLQGLLPLLRPGFLLFPNVLTPATENRPRCRMVPNLAFENIPAVNDTVRILVKKTHHPVPGMESLLRGRRSAGDRPKSKIQHSRRISSKPGAGARKKGGELRQAASAIVDKQCVRTVIDF